MKKGLTFPPYEARFLEFAEGWLELGNLGEAEDGKVRKWETEQVGTQVISDQSLQY